MLQLSKKNINKMTFFDMKKETRGGRFELPWSETNGLAIHRRCRAGPSSQRNFHYESLLSIKRLCMMRKQLKYQPFNSIYALMRDWTEKYRPRSVKDIVGNRNNIQKIVSWAQEWNRCIPQKRAVILSGKPGTGKTSIAIALAYDFQWIPLELNASDARNASRIKSVVTAGALHQSFQDTGEYSETSKNRRKLIILDEADHLYDGRVKTDKTGHEFGDRGGKQAIIDTIKKTKQPIVLIVNNYYNLIKGKGSALRTLCHHFKWHSLFPNQISQILLHIARGEHLSVDPTLLQQISDQADGDVRSAIHDLQSLYINKKQIKANDLETLGGRDRSSDIFKTLRLLFTSTDTSAIKQRITLLQMDPQLLLYWITENLPKAYYDPIDRSNAFNMLSKSDVFLGRTFRRQSFSLWSYASDLMVIGVALTKTKSTHSANYDFPTWLRVRKAKKKRSVNETSILQKLSQRHHCSIQKVIKTIYPYYKTLVQNNDEFTYEFIKTLGLSEEEAIDFYDSSPTSARKKIKTIMKKYDEQPQEIFSSSQEKISEEEEKNSKQQKSLFHF